MRSRAYIFISTLIVILLVNHPYILVCQTINCSNYEEYLEELSDESLSLRISLRDTVIKYGHDSPERQRALEKMIIGDSIILVRLNKIVEKCGFRLTKDMSEKSYSGVFLAINHSSDLAVLINYRDLLIEEAKNNPKLNKGIATLIDRILVNQNKRQLYGTQYGSNKEIFRGYVWPVEDFGTIDIRRIEMGLDSFSVYLNRRNLNYKDSIKVEDFIK